MKHSDEFLQRAVAESEMSWECGWRPWMGPEPEPTPEERAAVQAARAEAKRRWLALVEAGAFDEPPFLGPPWGPVAAPAEQNGTPSANGHPAPATAVSPSPSAPA